LNLTVVDIVVNYTLKMKLKGSMEFADYLIYCGVSQEKQASAGIIIFLMKNYNKNSNSYFY
jgi:hypothetical protein